MVTQEDVQGAGQVHRWKVAGGSRLRSCSAELIHTFPCPKCLSWGAPGLEADQAPQVYTQKTGLRWRAGWRPSAPRLRIYLSLGHQHLTLLSTGLAHLQERVHSGDLHVGTSPSPELGL